MKNRTITSLVLVSALAMALAPAAIAADLTDVGFLDQAEVGSLPAFVSANRQLAQYKQQLDGQFAQAMKSAHNDADRQRIQMQFSQEFSDKQRELVGPLFSRAQLAIAQVSASKNLSVVVDKRIVVYGGQDITRDVENMITSGQAIPQPSSSPPPSEIGYVDQNELDSVPKVKQANDDFTKFAQDTRTTYAAKMAQAKTPGDKQAIAADFNKTLQAKQESLIKPLVDATKAATASVAGKHNLLLVVDRGDIVSGGTDITQDVQNALSK